MKIVFTAILISLMSAQLHAHEQFIQDETCNISLITTLSINGVNQTVRQVSDSYKTLTRKLSEKGYNVIQENNRTRIFPISTSKGQNHAQANITLILNKNIVSVVKASNLCVVEMEMYMKNQIIVSKKASGQGFFNFNCHENDLISFIPNCVSTQIN